MRLALTLGYSGARMTLDMDLVQEVERLGYDSIWSAESYGSDAVTPVAWSRISISPAGRLRPRPRFPTPSWTRSRSAAHGSGSASSWANGARRE